MSYRYHGYLHTLTKLGASRIDKEIAKGNLTWGRSGCCARHEDAVQA